MGKGMQFRGFEKRSYKWFDKLTTPSMSRGLPSSGNIGGQGNFYLIAGQRAITVVIMADFDCYLLQIRTCRGNHNVAKIRSARECYIIQRNY